MDLLFKAVTARNCVALLLFAAFSSLGFEYRTYPLRLYREWRYPAVGAAPAQGSTILEDAQRREAGRIEARYRRVLARLALARTEGFKVDVLEHKARAALTLNTETHRRRALKLLGEVELAIPRRPAPYVAAATSAAESDDIEPDVAPRKIRRRR